MKLWKRIVLLLWSLSLYGPILKKLNESLMNSFLINKITIKPDNMGFIVIFLLVASLLSIFLKNIPLLYQCCNYNIFNQPYRIYQRCFRKLLSQFMRDYPFPFLF